MLLAIDSGNTNIVFAIFGENDEIQGEWRSSTDTNRTADEFGIWLEQLMQLEGIPRNKINAAIIATVVPATLFSLKTLCRKYFSCDPIIVGNKGVDLGIGIHVEKPDEVGADRLVNALAAHERYRGPLIIVDFGTATTFDVIDSEGGYLGGVIAPGVNLSSEALHQAAAQLPRVAVERPEFVVGNSTVTAMQSGIFWGYVSLIEGVVKRIKTEMCRDIDVIATGGLAPLFTQSIDTIRLFDDDLTLHGLLAVYHRNSG